jgi:hypothetical protein
MKQQPKKDEWWRYVLAVIVFGTLIGVFLYWGNHVHPAPDVCQTSPNSQSCADEQQDLQNCSDTEQQC